MAVAVQPAQASTQNGQQEKAANGALRKPRPKRPNYHEIHAKPLPLEVYPLPAFIPHNPISIVRIAITLLSHSIWRPQSHVIVHKAYYSPETQSIHVTDPASIRALWEQGFWGKGSLSRSEPQWLVAEKRKQGAEASKTSTEVTQSRREERKQFKLERAKAQREAIEQQLRQEGKLEADGSIDELVEDGQVSESPKGTLYTTEARDIVTVKGDSIVSGVGDALANGTPAWGKMEANTTEEVEIHDLEHLQLTPEEAFFLTYVLGVLDVVKHEDLEAGETSKSYPAWYLMRLYCGHTLSPGEVADLHAAFKLQEGVNQIHPTMSCIPHIAPDNPFIMKYVVYHHFRSLGWVVRPGIKFAVDFLLYMRGPAFSHAEFAIMIVPSYSNPYWADKSGDEAIEGGREKDQKDWWWLHRVNRVQTQVMKTLMLVYVEVPEPWDEDRMKNGLEFDVGSMLKKYTVREFVFRRWSPSRNRD